MPEQQPLEAKKPAKIIRVVLTDDQTLESRTIKYTEKEIRDMFLSEGAQFNPIEWYGVDENDEPVYCCILKPSTILAVMILDFDSYVKHQTRLRGMAGGAGPAPRIATLGR